MNHTARLAISTNVLIEDDTGQRLAALLAPVLVLSVWFPMFLLTWPTYALRTTHYVMGWIEAVVWCCAAVGLLIIERRLHDES